MVNRTRLMWKFPARCVLACALCTTAKSRLVMECPLPGIVRSTDSGAEISVAVRNTLNRTINLWWVSSDGEEVAPIPVQARKSVRLGTFVEHCFRARLLSGHLIDEFCVEAERFRKAIRTCAGLPDEDFLRNQEFQALMHDPQTPCVPANDSSKWSCVRYLEPADVAMRDCALFGFTAEELKNDRDIVSGRGGTVDRLDGSHLSQMPKLTEGPGYAIMDLTPQMLEVLDWYDTVFVPSTLRHEPLPGYTNINTVPMRRVFLDRFVEQKEKLTDEMQDVLEWWTGMPLVHTATYGVRVYSRGSMLVDHLDTAETHLASAVIQIDQQVDHDGGWPLELLLANGTVAEVFVQRGQMILYEGGWLRHGRPMRLRGDSFSNVFVHFSPVDWTGNNEQSSEMYAGVPDDRFTTIADPPVNYYSCTAESSERLRRMYSESPSQEL